VAGGVVYAGSYNDDVYALNATTGALIWTYKTGSWVLSSPAVADGVVYVGSLDDHVYALNATTGALVWKYKTDNVVDSSPAVAGGVVYVGSEDDKVYAFGPVSQRTSYTLPLVVAGAIVIVAIALFIVAVVRRERKRRLPSESVLPGSENGVKGSQFLFSGS